MTDTLTVRASGTAAGGVPAAMQVLLDGVLLGSVDVGAVAADFSFATLPMGPGNVLQVVLANPGTLGDSTRALTMAYAINGITVLRPGDRGVVTSSVATQGTWPPPNLTDRITVRARADLAGGVGAIMQVLVDDVLTFSTEVRNTTFADFSVPALRMRAGSKVEVVFTNDGMVAGVDRNLYIDHLVSGGTFMRPTDSGSVIDRGVGDAAFDGQDVIAGQGGMYWGGAWRATWPLPNITSSVTVRASGTLAGGTGPIMQLRVDGVPVSSAEVRSPTLADYTLATPPLRPGSQVDLVYTNDAVIDGADRNLTVAYLRAGATYVLPTMPSVRYDLGTGNAALDGVDSLPGQAVLSLAGALRLAWPDTNIADTITVRAYASLAAGTGALMQLRVDGVLMGQTEVRSTTPADHVFSAPRLSASSRIDVAFVNDANTNGEDRNLYVHYLLAQGRVLVPTAPNVVIDLGVGEQAFDGQGTRPGDAALTSDGALRFVAGALPVQPVNQAARYAASRFLQQAGFGAGVAEIDRVAGMGRAAWLAEQLAIPPTAEFVPAVQQQYDRGDAWRPRGQNYSHTVTVQRFWQGAANAPDPLRKRVAFALHHMLMVSQADSNLYEHARAYAQYLDTLNRQAFGNYRNLLEDIALSPVMGIYLSHMRNRPEDPASGRMPDENFARELMQLLSIGLHELNIDGTPRQDGNGNLIETYTNNDVMALAKVFTGYGWAFPDNELTEAKLRAGVPDYSKANDTRIDLQRMKAYPGQHSTAEKRLFVGKGHAVVIAANTAAADSLRLALDAVFNHPNVGPFVGRQLIQRLVASNPSPAYVARVAAVFNNNGSGVRGDMGAVVRAVLLDAEAVNPPAGSMGKLREPVLRVAHWLRSFGARSLSNQWQMVYDLDDLNQRALHAPSVFGYFRPGFVPPNTALAISGATAPELQIVNESTTAHWANTALDMAGAGLGWTGSSPDVVANLQPLADLAAAGDVTGLVERLNLLLFAGRMGSTLQGELLQAITSVAGNDAASHMNRARVAVFLALASSNYLVQP